MAVVHALSVCGMRQYTYRTRQIVVFFFYFLEGWDGLRR